MINRLTLIQLVTMEFFNNWFNYNNIHFTSSSSSNETLPSKSDILKCFSYNLIHYIQCYLPIFPNDADKIYKDSCDCIDSSFATLDSKYTTRHNGLNRSDIAHHYKILSIFILDNVLDKLRKLKQKLKSISDDDMLGVKQFIDDISIELPQLLMNKDQRDHLVQYLISPYKNQSKIDVIQEMLSTNYLITHTTINSDSSRQYIEISPLSSKSNDKQSHLYFCKDGSITLKLEKEVNPFIVKSSFFLHQDSPNKWTHLFTFYSQIFSKSFSTILTNTCYDNQVYRSMLEKTFDMTIINLQIHLQHNLGTSISNAETLKRLHSRYSKVDLQMKKLSKKVLPLHSITYYYFLDPRYNILDNDEVDDMGPENSFLYFENQNLIKEDEQEIYVKHPHQLFYQYYLKSLDDLNDPEDDQGQTMTSTTPSLYEERYRLHRAKWISRDPDCFSNGFKHCQLSALDANVKQLFNLCLVTMTEFNLFELYKVNGTRVMTLDFCQGKISFSIPEQTRSSSSSSVNSELFTDLIESCFYEEYQKEQEVLRKQLTRLSTKHNNKLQIYGTDEWVLHQRDHLFVYQDEVLNSLDSVYEKIIQTHLTDSITVKDVFDSIQSFDEELQHTTCEFIYKTTHNKSHIAINADRFIRETIGEIAKRRNSTTKTANDKSSTIVHPLLDLHEKTIRGINKEYETKEKQKQIFIQLQSGTAFDNFTVY